MPCFCFTLLGSRLQKDQQYTMTFPRQIHLSSAILCLDSMGSSCQFDCLVEVHVVENGTDHFIGVLGGVSFETNPTLQCNINIKLDPSRPVSFYVKTAKTLYHVTPQGFSSLKLSKAPLAVQLVGYFD